MFDELLAKYSGLYDLILKQAGSIQGSLPTVYNKMLDTGDKIDRLLERKLPKPGLDYMIWNVSIYLNISKQHNYFQDILKMLIRSAGSNTIELEQYSRIHDRLDELEVMIRNYWIWLLEGGPDITIEEDLVPLDKFSQLGLGDDDEAYSVVIGLYGSGKLLEESKDDILIPGNMDLDISNKKHNCIQYSILGHQLTPLDQSRSLNYLASNVFSIKSANKISLDSLCKKLKCGYIVFNLVRPRNYEYTIRNLTEIDYIKDNDLYDDMSNGVNKINIARLDTVRSVDPESNKTDYSFQANVKNQKYVLILDTHDGDTYRILARGDTVLHPIESVKGLLKPETSSSRRLEAYNGCLNEELYNNLTDPVELPRRVKSNWNDINERIVSLIMSELRDKVKSKKITVKTLEEIVTSDEFYYDVKNLILKYLKVQEMGSYEVQLTSEYEIYRSVSALVDRLKAIFRYKSQLIRKEDRSKIFNILTLYVRNNTYIVFNDQNNIFNAIQQKAAIVKALHGRAE